MAKRFSTPPQATGDARMTGRFEESMTVQDAAAQYPYGASVLLRFGIAPDDTCILAEASSREHIPIKLLMAALNKTASAAELTHQIDDDRLQATLQGVIIEYVVERYHRSLESELARLDELLNTVVEARDHGEGSKLVALRMIFRTFKTQIEEHLTIEEQILFPRLLQSERYAGSQGTTTEARPGSSPVTAISEMEHEHEMLEGSLKEMRRVTGGYALPHNSSEMLIGLYEGFLKLEIELLEHVHLENDLLWPAGVMEKVPSDTTVSTDASTPTADEKESICPRINLPCEEGSPAACSRFWNCVREAMEQRWAKVDGANRDA